MTSTMVFTIVFGIHYNFFIALPICLFAIFIDFFTSQDLHARKIVRVSKDFRPSVPDRHRACNLSRPGAVKIS